jgi:hypothetical protein
VRSPLRGSLGRQRKPTRRCTTRRKPLICSARSLTAGIASKRVLIQPPTSRASLRRSCPASAGRFHPIRTH